MTTGLWAMQLNRALKEEEIQALMTLLPPARRDRLVRVRKKERMREPLCAYLLLRQALWERYGWSGLPEIIYGHRGKPYFREYPEVHFNLSHTEGAVLIGISDVPIGVDIQRIRPVSRQAMQRLSEGNTKEAFFRDWVRREARTKCTGDGVASMLEEEPSLQEGEFFSPLDIFPGYAAGVAVRGACMLEEVKIRKLDELEI